MKKTVSFLCLCLVLIGCAENKKDKIEMMEEEIEIFEPVLGEVVSDDSFSFTLLSCHCSNTHVRA